MKKQTEELIFRLKDMNNKSRKGMYAYVKLQGKKGGYYRYIGPEKADSIKKHYLDLVNQGIGARKGAKAIQQANKIRKVAQSSPNISTSIRKGKTEATLTDAFATDQFTVRALYIKALKPLVKDKDLLGILTQESNMQKLRNRCHCEMTFLDQNSAKVGHTNTTGQNTPGEVIDMIKANFRKGSAISSFDFSQICTLLNWQSTRWDYTESNAILDSVRVRFVFRKPV